MPQGQFMITRRNGIYYYRKAVPQHLRHSIGMREFIVSLKTRDGSEALHRAQIINVYCSDLIAKTESGELVLNSGKKLNLGKLLNIQTTSRVIERPDGTRETITSRDVSPDDIFAMKKIGLDDQTIRDIITKADIKETIKRAMTGAGFEYEDNDDDKSSEPTLEEAIKQFTESWEREEGKEFCTRKITQFNRLSQIVGQDKKIRDISRQDAIEVRDTLARMPKNSTKFAKQSISDVIATLESKEPEYERFTATTIERHFETYRTLFNWAIDSGLTNPPNAFEKVKIVTGGLRERLIEKERKDNASKTPYSDEELDRMFSTDFFTNFGSKTEHEGVKFWLPLIGLLTGSRMSQIASLYCDDIKEQDGIPIIDFNFETDDKLGKTGDSFRPVPIHPLLLKLGIREYAQKVKSYKICSDYKDASRLFPELRTYARGSYARRVEEWFNRNYLYSLGIRERHDGKSFHAFRSTLLRLLKKAGVTDEYTRNCIIGWAKNEDGANKVTRAHYETSTLKDMYEALSAITLPASFDEILPFPIDKEIDFSRKYPNQWSQN